jgi:ArsR family transcriptional regulator, arsenate/arsenite/antimonite-responsive transcriptional repressor / arsenate reductase (thioredoxin)
MVESRFDERSLAGRARVYAALGDPGRLAIVDMLAYGDASPGEVGRALEMPTNLVAHHLKVLEEAGVVVRTRSEGDRRRTYLRLVGEHADLARIQPWRVPRVVFVCSRNSARSQLAAALWARRHVLPAASAGTEPAGRVHPRAVRVARRHGLSLGRVRPTHVADVVRGDDLIVAVCDNAHEQLTASPQRRLHWSVPDPAPVDTDDAFEAAYTDLAGRIDRLAPVLTQGDPS